MNYYPQDIQSANISIEQPIKIELLNIELLSINLRKELLYQEILSIKHAIKLIRINQRINQRHHRHQHRYSSRSARASTKFWYQSHLQRSKRQAEIQRRAKRIKNSSEEKVRKSKSLKKPSHN